MRVDFDHRRRTATAEMYRRRAAWLRQQSEGSSMSAVRLEMEDEASWLEKSADSLMDFSEAVEKIANVVPTRNIDISSVDAPPTKEPPA